MTNQAAIARAVQQLKKASSPAKGPTVLVLQNPNVELATQRSIDHINALRSIGRPENTAKTCDPKVLEFKECCHSEYPYESPPEHVSKNKVWWFLLYQAMRGPKRRGGKKKGKTKLKYEKFDKAECDKIIGPFKATTGPVVFVTPKNAVGFECVNQCKKVIKALHHQQTSDGKNNIGWEFIWSTELDNLIKHVKERKPAMKRANYVEKQNQEFAPYKIVASHGKLEALFWNDAINSLSGRTLCARLRHRCCFLLLTSSVLRCESLYRAEISDFFGLVPPMKSNDIHSMCLQIHQIPVGKTTHGAMQCGRAGRHLDVFRCSVGATALHMEAREGITKEFSSMTLANWRKNSHWFDIKFLVDANAGTRSNTKDEMKSDTCGDKVRLHLEKLGLPMNKVLHLGRNIGTKYLDIMEVDAAEVKRMGQWNQSTYEKSYSSKLPMLAIRNLAGFDAANGMHFNTRTQVEPPDDLIAMTHLGSLSNSIIHQFLIDDPSKHPTAWGVLNWMYDLAKILLQDLAYMKSVVDPRDMGYLEKEFTFMRTKQFEEFTEKMKRAHKEEVCPFDASIDKCLPGVNLRFERAEQQRHRQCEEMMETMKAINDNIVVGFQDCRTRELERELEVPRMLGAALVETGTQVIARAEAASVGPLSPVAPTGSPTTSPEQQPLPVQMELEVDTMDSDPSLFKLTVKHVSLKNMFSEWHGLGNDADCFGGVAGRNERYKGKWRKDARIDASHYSRHNRLMVAISAEARRQSVQPVQIVEEWEPLFVQANYVTGNLVNALQRLGKIPTKKSRGKTKKDGQEAAGGEATGEDEGHQP